MDAAKKAANDPSLTPEQRAAAQQRADELNANWGPGGTYRQLLTALSVAAGGNVTGGVGQFAQSATVAYLQELGTNEVKRIADSLGNEDARAALHAIVGCAGAAASGQSCGAGAMGAAASSVLGSLLTSSKDLSSEEREARSNLVTSLVAGIAATSGLNAATAAGAAKIEVENNQVSFAPAPPLPPLPGFTGEAAKKGDGVIADPATELDPRAKTGSLVQPAPEPQWVDQAITATKDAARKIVDNILTATDVAPVPDATPGRETKGRSTLWEKPGGMPEANQDFDNLRPSNVRDLPNGGRFGQLPDGRTVVVRPDSSDGRPTSEIQSGKNKQKVRYGS